MADIIDELMGLDDDALVKRIGVDKQIANFRKQLTEMAGFDGKWREEAAERLDRVVNPTPHVQEINWINDDIQREQRQAAAKGGDTAVAEINNTSPSSLAPPE